MHVCFSLVKETRLIVTKCAFLLQMRNKRVTEKPCLGATRTSSSSEVLSEVLGASPKRNSEYSTHVLVGVPRTAPCIPHLARRDMRQMVSGLTKVNPPFFSILPQILRKSRMSLVLSSERGKLKCGRSSHPQPPVRCSSSSATLDGYTS